MKKTAIIGASTNPSRYAYIASKRLADYGHEIVPIGIKKGKVFGQDIQDLKSKPKVQDLDTITLYLNPSNQENWQEYILHLCPKRVIFNPGTENPAFAAKLQSEGIEAINACTLVMLASDQY